MSKYLFLAANEWGNWGGSELLWSQAAEKLARRGHEVRVSVAEFHITHPRVEKLRAAGCRIFGRRGFPPFLYRWGSKVLSLPEYKRRELRSAAGGADLVVISQGGLEDGLWWLEAARAEGLNYILIVQGTSYLSWPNDEKSERLAASFAHAAAAYFVSQATLDLCKRQLVSPIYNGKVIRNPFNVRYDAKFAWPNGVGDGLALACVARLDGAGKGHDILLDVLNLPHWRERNIRLSMVGSGGSERLFGRLAESLGLRNVKFIGQCNQIDEVWRTHQALVLPTRFEGMPLVVVEAMLCGRPCITTDVGGSRELIRDGVNGYLARAATVEFLDEAMNRAWENRHRLKEMGETAASDARQWVSADPGEDFARELENVVNGVKG